MGELSEADLASIETLAREAEIGRDGPWDPECCVRCNSCKGQRPHDEPSPLCDTCAHILAEHYAEDAPRLVAEVRRLRELDTAGYNAGFATGQHAGLAAGYAQATADAVAIARKEHDTWAAKSRDAVHGGLRETYRERANGALCVAIELDSGAHRGAAKAQRGEEG